MQNEIVLVTGASSGIGRSLAHLFAESGSKLVIVARSGDKLNELREELRTRYGTESVVIVQDLATPDAIDQICESLERQELDVDVLVNNAGFGALGRFAELPIQRQAEMVQVNIAALTLLTRQFLPRMVAKGRGGILNVGSIAAFQAGPNMAVYYASKAYVLSFSEAIREEVKGDGVTVTCLAPGPTQTSFGSDSGMGKLKMFSSNAASVESVALAGYRGFRSGKDVVVPGLSNKMMVMAVKFLPRSMVRKMVKRMQPV